MPNKTVKPHPKARRVTIFMSPCCGATAVSGWKVPKDGNEFCDYPGTHGWFIPKSEVKRDKKI